MKYKAILFLLIPITILGQGSIDEIKKNVYSNPFSQANQNYIRMLSGEGSSGNNTKELLLEDWGRMAVLGVGNTRLEVDSANYMIAEDKVYFIEGGKLYFLYPGQVERLALAGKLFACFKSDPSEGNGKLGYFEVLVDGEIQLLKKYSLKERRYYDNALGIGGIKKERYQHKALYFFKQDNGKAMLIPDRKGEVIRIFGRKRSKMVDFAKQQELGLASEQDMRILFSYYNMLARSSPNG